MRIVEDSAWKDRVINDPSWSLTPHDQVRDDVPIVLADDTGLALYKLGPVRLTWDMFDSAQVNSDGASSNGLHDDPKGNTETR